MKREYIFLVVVIVALSLYLILRSSDKTHYRLPEMMPVEQSDITKLVISRADSSVILRRLDERWLIEPRGYPIDSGEIDKMLGAVGNLTLTTLVSESRNYNQYDLGDEQKIGVEAFSGDELLRKFDIGKTASTYRHTFVRLAGDDKVYQAREDIRRPFDADIEKLRDKSVLKFMKDDVRGLEIVRGTESLQLTRNETGSDVVPEVVPDSVAAEPKPPWQADDGKAADEKVIDRMVNTMADLKCDSYVYGREKADFTDPIYSVTVLAEQGYVLSIFDKEAEGNKYPAVSSENDYPFLLSEWKVKQIMKEPAEILGEKQPQQP